jgi:hypothetical protein
MNWSNLEGYEYMHELPLQLMRILDHGTHTLSQMVVSSPYRSRRRSRLQKSKTRAPMTKTNIKTPSLPQSQPPSYIEPPERKTSGSRTIN